MFDLEAFEAAFAAWDANSGQCGCMGAQQETVEASGLIEDALAEVRRLRAEREQAATVRHVWGVYEDMEAP